MHGYTRYLHGPLALNWKIIIFEYVSVSDLAAVFVLNIDVLVVTLLRKALFIACRVQCPSLLEPPGLCCNDEKHVDGVTLIPCAYGRYLAWDATCAYTFAPSYLSQSSRKCGLIAENAARDKIRLYTEVIETNYIFVQITVETMGSWCNEASDFLHSLGRLKKN